MNGVSETLGVDRICGEGVSLFDGSTADRESERITPDARHLAALKTVNVLLG